jgi:DNA-binding HxlR family transcriptional regulator
VNNAAHLGACISFFQYAPFGKYQIRKRARMKDRVPTCGLDAALLVLGGKWKPLILFHLTHGARRYGELRRAVGNVSDKVLIQQLKELHADGVIDRVDFGEIPPKVEYSVTGFGRTLAKALIPLCEWGTKHSGEVEAILARRATPQQAQLNGRGNADYGVALTSPAPLLLNHNSRR